MSETIAPKNESKTGIKLRFPNLGGQQALVGGGVGGVSLGLKCYDSVLTETFVDFDGEGHVVGIHFVDVGTC